MGNRGVWLRDRLGSVFEAVGLLMVTAGVGMWHPAAGLVTGGVGLVVFGIAIESTRGR